MELQWQQIKQFYSSIEQDLIKIKVTILYHPLEDDVFHWYIKWFFFLLEYITFNISNDKLVDNYEIEWNSKFYNGKTLKIYNG